MILSEWLFAIFLLGSMVALVPGVRRGLAAQSAAVMATVGLVGAVTLLGQRVAAVTHADWFSVAGALFVAVLSVLIQVFSLRHLRGDVRQRWFVCWVNVLTAGSILVVCAPSVIWFAAGWTGVGIGLVMLLNTYPDLAQARQGVRRAAVNLGIGDLALWAAVLVLTIINGGDVHWGQLPQAIRALPGPVQVVAGLLLVVAALSRSAQFPFHTWLSVTLAAPTPVSAVMHAGVVNGAAFVVIRFAPAVTGSAVAVWALFLAGGVTLMIGAAGMLVRPDLKGRLVASTTAQMGFMVMTLGVGAYAAAVFHLMGHGFYKANLFLRSGSQIGDLRHDGSRPSAPHTRNLRRTAAGAMACLFPAGAIIATTVALGGHAGASTLVLAGYGCVTAAVLLYEWVRREDLPWYATAVAVMIVTAGGCAYAGVVNAAGRLLGSGLPVSSSTIPTGALLIPFALMLGISVLPALPASRLPAVYGLVSGLSQSRLVRIPRMTPGTSSHLSHPVLVQEPA